jgi:hypothetical protein
MVSASAGLDVQRDTSPPSAPLAFFILMMLLAPVTNLEPHGVTLAGYCYAMRHLMEVQIVTPYRVSHLQRYVVTRRGKVTSIHLPLEKDHDRIGGDPFPVHTPVELSAEA